MPKSDSRRLAWALRFLALFLGYYACGHIGPVLAASAGLHGIFNGMAAGVALAAFLRWELSLWPAVWLGAFALGLASGNMGVVAAAMACGSTAGPWLVAWILRKLGVEPPLRGGGNHCLYLIIGVFGGMALTATNGVLQLWLAGYLPAPGLRYAWLVWWLGDVQGGLTVGLALVTAETRCWRSMVRGPRRIELALVFAIVLGAAYLAFSEQGSSPTTGLLLYVPFLLLCYLAVRTEAGMACTMALVVSASALWATAQGHGPFQSDDLHHEMSLLWGYTATLSIVTALVSALAGELRAKEQHMRLAINAAHLGLWTWDAQTDRFAYGGNLENVRGMCQQPTASSLADWMARIHPDDLPKVRARMREYFSGADSLFEIEYRLKSDDGQWNWIGARGQAVERGPAGRPLHLAGVFVNLNERKRNEAALIESEHRFRQIFERNRAVKLIIDPADGRIEDANQAACKYYGYSRDQLLGLNISAINTLSPREIAEEMKMAQSESRLYFRFRHRLASGEIRDVEVYSGPISTGQGDLLYSIVHDVTERNELEEELKKFQLFSQYASDAHILIDAQAHIRYANAQACESLGYTEEELLKLSIPDIDPVFDMAAVQAHMEEAKQGRTAPFETVHRAKNGKVFPVEVSSTALNFKGEWLAFTACRDITERKEAESRLRLAASVFANAHEGIMICDARLRIVDVNPMFTEISGYRKEEIRGRSVRLLDSRRHDKTFFKALWRTLKCCGFWEGEVWERRKDGTVYPTRLNISSVQAPQEPVSHYIVAFTDTSELKEHQARLEFLAHYDALTRLPNRALLSERMQMAFAQARRIGQRLAVCYLDLDGFKRINDELGHDAGDAVLVEVAQRLQHSVRLGDTVARLGGDEFVLLLLGVENRSACDQVLARVLEAIHAPLWIKAQQRFVSASIGFTLFPDDDGDPDTLLRHADQAMYRVKQTGKNRQQMFEAALA
ncbi:PAS domain S-box protein [uncultured Azohydromonas sp.]|jgi:PAS domain S-box/diguanylate cyclase (GGDEF) domain|uniref:PAS domain S-box protein n=1 Tax=uncultured Azohydromonas sp. TaxID=487342 RepID=UPI002625001B|nr:PAS domain S-box protein [uncultured Azohydromonas sp.]